MHLKNKLLSSLLVLCLVSGALLFAGCSTGTDGEAAAVQTEAPATATTQPDSEQPASGTPQPDSEEAATPAPLPDGSERTPAEISESAMENYVAKLEAANFEIDIDGYLKISAFSPEQVVFSYYDEKAKDHAFLTLSGETFRAALNDDAIESVSFVSTDNAITIPGSALPSGWPAAAEGNMFELFYNNPEQPLEFISKDETVKVTLLQLCGYNVEMTIARTEDVHMLLDAEDPSSVRFLAVIEDDEAGRHYFDDIDLTMQFGTAQSDPRIDAWCSDPVFPEARTAWTDNDLFYLNSVFFSDHNADVVPFPDFLSYASSIDDAAFNAYDMFRLIDVHGTQDDIKHYQNVLIDNGFAAVGEGMYRRVLREDYRCYTQIHVYFDNGFVLEASRWYDNPFYETLTDINSVLEANGFAALTDSEYLDAWQAVDSAAERSESWLYFFRYDLYMRVDVRYDNEEALNAYLSEYGKQLEANGFIASYTTDDEGNTILDRYESPNGYLRFRYGLNGDGTVSFEFRRERNIAPEDAMALIAAAGIPEVSLTDEMTARELSEYYRHITGFDGKLYLAVSQPFADSEEAERFLTAYTAALDEAGFLETYPDKVGTLKQFVYYNAEADKYVAFDFIRGEDSASVNFDFVSNS